jgi:hypothetical protein
MIKKRREVKEQVINIDNKIFGKYLTKLILSYNPKRLGGYSSFEKPRYIEDVYVIDTVCKDKPLIIKVWREEGLYFYDVYFKDKLYKAKYDGYCLDNLINKIVKKGEPTNSKYINLLTTIVNCDDVIKEYIELINEENKTKKNK